MAFALWRKERVTGASHTDTQQQIYPQCFSKLCFIITYLDSPFPSSLPNEE